MTVWCSVSNGEPQQTIVPWKVRCVNILALHRRRQRGDEAEVLPRADGETTAQHQGSRPEPLRNSHPGKIARADIGLSNAAVPEMPLLWSDDPVRDKPWPSGRGRIARAGAAVLGVWPFRAPFCGSRQPDTPFRLFTKTRNGYLRRIFHQQVNMIISAVHVDQGGLEVGTSFLMNSGKRCSQDNLAVLGPHRLRASPTYGP